ncbi:MAG: hypothetical protein Q4D21_06320 [Phascolarctobacterium sp.]|nr:hypothetical protein [Phascolarctobacterium sp.]
MPNPISLNGCLAIKQGDLDKAKQCVEQAASMNDKIFIEALKDMMLMAIRRHHHQVLTHWMDIAIPRLKIAVASPDNFAECQDFLESFIFAICDHRIAILRGDAQAFTEIFHESVDDVLKLEPFYQELASLASRMTARKWDDEATWLLQIVLDNTVKEDNLKLIESILYQVNMHAVMHAKACDFGRMMDIYKAEQITYMLLVTLASHTDVNQNDAREHLRVCLRNERNLMSNIARITMKDEMEVYQDWYNHMMYYFGKNERLKTLALLLIQLTITYWCKTQPKSSRKQARFLENILNPSIINEHFHNLLNQIV